MLSRFRADSGSAASDFVLLVVPASLLVIPLIDLFGLYQSAIVKEQIAYEIARYAALADVTPEDAAKYNQLRDTSSQLFTESSPTSCSLVSNSEINRKITFWPEVIKVPIQGRVECEN